MRLRWLAISANAKLGQTEVKIGIPPGWGGTQRMFRILGPAKPKELIFTGETITADESLKIGLVNKVVSLDTKFDLLNKPSSSEVEEQVRKISTGPKGEDTTKLLNNRLMDECIRLGGEITKNSYNAIKVSKMLINKGMDADLQTGLHLEINGGHCVLHMKIEK